MALAASLLPIFVCRVPAQCKSKRGRGDNVVDGPGFISATKTELFGYIKTDSSSKLGKTYFLTYPQQCLAKSLSYLHWDLREISPLNNKVIPLTSFLHSSFYILTFRQPLSLVFYLARTPIYTFYPFLSFPTFLPSPRLFPTLHHSCSLISDFSFFPFSLLYYRSHFLCCRSISPPPSFKQWTQWVLQDIHHQKPRENLHGAKIHCMLHICIV